MDLIWTGIQGGADSWMLELVSGSLESLLTTTMFGGPAFMRDDANKNMIIFFKKIFSDESKIYAV